MQSLTFNESFTLTNLLKMSTCFLLTMQRYDDFHDWQWITAMFCIKTAFLLMYIKTIVCEHTPFVCENSHIGHRTSLYLV